MQAYVLSLEVLLQRNLQSHVTKLNEISSSRKITILHLQRLSWKTEQCWIIFILIKYILTMFTD